MRFYGELFGWTAEDAGEDYGHYHNFSKDGALVGGLMRRQPDAGGHPDFWMTYLSSADAKATAAAAADAGGQVLLEPMAVMELGAMAVLGDSTGGAVGVWQPGRHRGFEVHGEAGAPVWHELHTRDHAGAVAFYQRVFGWHTSVVSDTDEFRYTTMTEGEEQWPASWTPRLPARGDALVLGVYFGVADTDARWGRRAARGHGAGPGHGHPARPDGQGGRPDRARSSARSPSRPDRGARRGWVRAEPGRARRDPGARPRQRPCRA